MSLLDTLIAKAAETVNDEERQKKWVEKGFDSALAEARKLLPDAPSDLGDEGVEAKALRETAEFGLDKLEKHRDTLASLGAHGLRSTITLVGLGKYDDAAKHAALLRLRKSASWGEVSNAILSVAREGNEAKRQLDAEIEELKAALKDIGVTVAKSVLPLLLAVI